VNTKLTVTGWPKQPSKQIYTHNYMHKAISLVWGPLRLTPVKNFYPGIHTLYFNFGVWLPKHTTV